jgi:demethylmenaquinone methyltransferase/2-methoxy-6-polyprenyl-1,4-benzoquinol methylase
MSGYNQQVARNTESGNRDIIRMFDRISPVYDRMNRLMSLGMDRRWRRKAVAAIDIPNGAKVLDLACGTGDMGLEALSQVQNLQIVGVDPSPAMLAIARNRLMTWNTALSMAWGEQLPFRDSIFDRAMIAFGIRSFPNRLTALKELRRVVMPGGKLAILEMTSRKPATLESLFGWYFRHLVPAVGTLMSRHRHAYHYLPASVDAFPEPRDFAGEMVVAGWNTVSWIPMAGGVVTLFVAENQ